MKVGALQNILNDCKKDSEIIIFAETENKQYRPFKNINIEVYDKNSYKETVHLDISIYREYHNLHFPNNHSYEEIEDLKEQREMLLEQLDEVNKELEGFI